MNRLTITALALFFLCLAACRNFEPIQVTFQEGIDGYGGTNDAHILEANPNNNTGGHDEIEVGRYTLDTAGEDRYILIQFDVLSIPSDAVITRAILEVVYFKELNGTGTAKTINVHKVTSSWLEGDGLGSNGNPVAGVDWSGRPSFDPTPIDSQTLAEVTNRRHSFDITSAVQSWLSNSSPNYGVLLKPDISDDSVTNAPGAKVFASSENSSQSLRPILTVYMF